MYVNLVKLNEWIFNKINENLAEMNQVSIYEIHCHDLNKKMIECQDDNKKRLAKFIEKHIDSVSTECENFFNRTISKLSTPMTTI